MLLVLVLPTLSMPALLGEANSFAASPSSFLGLQDKRAPDTASIAVIEIGSPIELSVGKALTELGYSYDFYEYTFPVDYSMYDIVIQGMDGGYVHQIPELASFIDAGGCAIILGGSGWEPLVLDVDAYLMDVNETNYGWKIVTGTPDITVVNPAHPLASGLPMTYDFVDDGASFYMLRIVDPAVDLIATNGDGEKAIVAKPLGGGKFSWFVNSPYESYWLDPDDYLYLKTYLGNAITWCIPPPPENWVLLATDPDEGLGTNLRAIFGQLYSDVVYFKVHYYRPWTTINDIDAGIFVDADQNPSTGLPDGYYPGQNTGIGADYLIVVGWEATVMWKWDPIAEFWDTANPISLAYLDAPDGSNVFVVGVYLADVETTGALDCAVSDIPSEWDWMPNTGHFTFQLLQIAIYTDKDTYSAGDPMQLGLDITNPGNAVTVCIAIWLERPVGPIKVILHAHPVTLPAGLEYSNPTFKTFTLPSISPGTYTWHAAILNPATHQFLAHDLKVWEFI